MVPRNVTILIFKKEQKPQVQSNERCKEDDMFFIVIELFLYLLLCLLGILLEYCQPLFLAAIYIPISPTWLVTARKPYKTMSSIFWRLAKELNSFWLSIICSPNSYSRDGCIFLGQGKDASVMMSLPWIVSPFFSGFSFPNKLMNHSSLIT